VKVSLSAADNPTAEPTSANSAREPIDFLSIAAVTSFVIVHRVLTQPSQASSKETKDRNVTWFLRWPQKAQIPSPVANATNDGI
jgi:hypothetical protein